jgi:hypothetical protein
MFKTYVRAAVLAVVSIASSSAWRYRDPGFQFWERRGSLDAAVFRRQLLDRHDVPAH